MRRLVEPELIDVLPPAEAQAAGSRADMRRLNFIMGHAGIIARALRRQLAQTSFRARPLRLVELGAGDGTFLLRLARPLAALGIKAEATLLDRHNVVAAETRRAFAALHWTVESATTDVFDWLEQSSSPVEVMLANLFLHHFPDPSLGTLLRLAAARTNLFIACEPRRGALSLQAARLLRLMACNAVTRHDAPISVRAGFAGHELSALWPGRKQWQSSEHPAGLFSHCFVAKRNV